MWPIQNLVKIISNFLDVSMDNDEGITFRLIFRSVLYLINSNNLAIFDSMSFLFKELCLV